MSPLVEQVSEHVRTRRVTLAPHSALVLPCMFETEESRQSHTQIRNGDLDQGTSYVCHLSSLLDHSYHPISVSYLGISL